MQPRTVQVFFARAFRSRLVELLFLLGVQSSYHTLFALWTACITQNTAIRKVICLPSVKNPQEKEQIQTHQNALAIHPALCNFHGGG